MTARCVDEIRAKNEAAVERLRAAPPHPRVAARREAGLCEAHVHPAGTVKWRYCREKATTHDGHGRGYCTRHAADRTET